METFVKFLSVLILFGILIGWFHFTDWLGGKLDSAWLTVTLGLGVPIALTFALLF